MDLKRFKAAIQFWVSSELRAAGFSPSCLWNSQLLFRNLATGGFWYIAAIAASLYAAALPGSAIASYLLKGSNETLGPTLWNIVATAGLLGFGVTFLVPHVAFISKWSRHVLISAFISGCLMLATLTFQYVGFLGSPAEDVGAQYWVMIALGGALLLVCYALNFLILYLATLIHPNSDFMRSLTKLTPSLRIGGGALVLAAVAFGVAGTA
jgi:hypothetical protein